MSNEFSPPSGIPFRLCGLASDRVLFSRVSPSPEVFHHPKSEAYPNQWFVAIPGSGQYAGCYAIKSKVTGKVLFSRVSPDPRVGHVDGDGKYPDNWFKFEAGSGKYAGYFRLRAVSSDTVLVSRTTTGTATQVINYPANKEKYDDQYFTALFDKGNLGGPQYARPRITTLDASRLPAPPGGWKFSNLVDPSKIDSNLSRYPVLLFGSYTYTALTSAKNDNRMKIVAWDRNRNLVKELEKPGARYLWNISFNAGNQTVYFTGQSNQSIQATLDELVVRPAVVYLPSSSGPILPYTLTYAAANPSLFPVIKNGPYSFWPASFKDGRNSFCIAVADRDNLVQKLIECPGGKVIRDVQVNDAQRTIGLISQNGSKATFNYETALTCFYDFYNYTKDDFLLLAKDFNVPLSETDAAALAAAMPQIDCTLCCQMVGTVDEGSRRVKRSVGGVIVGVIVGVILGSLAGAAGGFLVGGPAGVVPGLVAGAVAGIGVGVTVPSRSDTGQYKLSAPEKASLVGYSKFPCGPFDNAGLRENIFDSHFPRYEELPYSAAVVKPGKGPAPQAYSPATKSVGAFPRDPRYKPFTVASKGVQVTKYIFIIVQAADTIDGKLGYQMRINPEDFYPDSWTAAQRVNHSQLSDGYRFWALMGDPHMQVYAAGSLYVDITNQKFLGIDTRTGHYFSSFAGQDKQVNDATLQFLANLGYSTSGVLGYTDIYGYLQSPM